MLQCGYAPLSPRRPGAGHERTPLVIGVGGQAALPEEARVPSPVQQLERLPCR